MLIIPAIDLRGGRCVRLRQGVKTEARVYDGDPVEVARRFVDEGAEWLHVVDLDGAFAETVSPNRAIIRRIARECGAFVQTGGGLRRRVDVEELVAAGAARVVLGTLAVEQPDLLEELAELYGAKIAVGIDARNGLVVTRGWETQAAATATDLARRVAGQGVGRIIYTDISRDGMLQGVNLEQTRAVAQAAGVPVTASGGVAWLADILALNAAREFGIDSVIVGKALYENRFTLREARSAIAK
jgi:phosphoribosylformimino-5-aminoimidazole carboxamide ribotide isomerase